MAAYYNRSQTIAERLVKLRDYLYANASPTHAVKAADILKYYADEGHEVEIKTVYSDLKTLEALFGMNLQYDGRKRGYLLMNPPFEAYELRSIVNSIQTAKFLPQQEADRLTRKIMRLADKYTRPSLNRQTYVPNRARSINEEVMRNLDIIYEAIAMDRKISYKYFRYMYSDHLTKEYYEVNSSKIITASPYSVFWSDEKFSIFVVQNSSEYMFPDLFEPSEYEDKDECDYDYEMVAVEHDFLPPYLPYYLALDCMEQIRILPDKREGKDFSENWSRSENDKNSENSAEMTKLNTSDTFVNLIVDKFGSEVTISPSSSFLVTVTIHQEFTPELYLWLRTNLLYFEIIFPENGEERMKSYFSDLLKNTYLPPYCMYIK